MPLKPWEIQADDSRQQDSITTFIIFCEDENAEPLYFHSFSIDGKLRINIIPNQKQGKINLHNTTLKCFEDGLMEVVSGRYKIKEGVTEHIWCVYDRDLENLAIANIRPIDDSDFTTAIQAAYDSGLNVAWSNDVFELWVLLHFETIATGTRLHRDYIYRRLTEVFKALPNQSEALKGITAPDYFYYKWHLKTKENFRNHVLPLLKERKEIALNNAKELADIYPDNMLFHDRNPCTMVYQLVQELLAYHVNE